MIKVLFFLIPTLAFSSTVPPSPFPVFLKLGFSSVLEFNEAPLRVVLGDNRNFQVEKLDRSLVIRTLAHEAVSNMFVYFKSGEPRLFVLRASDEAEPTYYKRFEESLVSPIKTQSSTPPKPIRYERSTRLLLSRFDPKKDYLSLDIQLTADSAAEIKPIWNQVRLSHNSSSIIPYQLWAERKEVQKDSRVKARFIFVKPSVPRDLKGVSLLIPIEGHKDPIHLILKGGVR